MRAVILLSIFLSAPAWADPVAIAKATELKAQAVASNQAFSLCMGCAAAHQAQLAAQLAQYLAQCAAEYPTAPQRLADCQQYYQTYYSGQ